MVNGNLPEGWRKVTIGEIAESINPGFPSGQHNQDNRGVPHIRPMNISRNGDINLSVVKYVEPKDYSPLNQGDVLFNNTNSPELVGKTTYIRHNTNWAYSNHMTRIRLRNDVAVSGWVANALHYLFLEGYFKLNCRHHVNQASVSSGFLAEIVTIPLPPLLEQERIVERIESLFTQLDAGVAGLKRVQVALRQYRAVVLMAAVEGRLLDVKGRAMAGELPKNWKWKRLGDVSVKITDGEHIRPNTTDTGVYFLSAKDVRDDGVTFNHPLLVSQEDAIKYRLRCNPEYGDILVVSRGATVGRTCFVSTSNVFCLLGSVILIKPNSQIDGKFLSYALKSVSVQKELIGISGSTAQQAIYIRDIRNVLIPNPSLEEQRCIVAEIERRLSVVDELEQAVSASLRRAARLRQAILKRAFEGRLL